MKNTRIKREEKRYYKTQTNVTNPLHRGIDRPSTTNKYLVNIFDKIMFVLLTVISVALFYSALSSLLL